MVAVTLIGAAVGLGAAALGLTTATVAGSALLGGALIYGGLATAAHFASKALAPKIPTLEGLDTPSSIGQQTQQTSLASTTAARWVLGRARTGGHIAWYYEEGEDVVHLVYVLSQGECETLHQVYIEGESLNITQAGTGYSGAVAWLPGANSDYRGKAEFWFYSGGTVSSAPASLAAVDSTYWNSTRQGVGLCFVHVKLTQPSYGRGTADVDYDSRFWTSIPQISFVLDGLKIRWPGQATPRWTRNAAAIRYWIETERFDRPAAAFDETSVISAIATCETRVTYDGGNDLRYTIDGVISSEDRAERLSEELDFTWQGFVIEIDGRLHFKPGRNIPNSEGTAFNVDDNMLEFIGAQPAPALSDRVNVISMTLLQSSAHNWLPTDLEAVEDTTSITRDGRRLRRGLGERRFISNPWTARRLMAIALRRARASATYSYRLAPGSNYENLSILPGSLLLVTDRTRGLNGTRLRVIHQSLETDWSVRLTLSELPTGIYADDAIVRPQRPRVFSVSKPSDEPSAPSNLSANAQTSVVDDGAVRSRLNISWTASPHQTVIAITSGDYRDTLLVSGGSAQADIPAPGNYTVTARHRNARGVDGPAATTIARVSWDALNPPAPVLSSLSLTGGLAIIKLNSPSRRDIAGVIVRYRYDESNTASPAVITDSDWGSVTDLGALPVSVADDGSIQTLFAVPASGAYRLAARYVTRGGLQSAIANLGVHALASSGILNWQGAWSATTAYEVGDLVRHNGSAWIADDASTGSEPTSSSTDWSLYAAGGRAGYRCPVARRMVKHNSICNQRHCFSSRNLLDCDPCKYERPTVRIHFRRLGHICRAWRTGRSGRRRRVGCRWSRI